MGLGAWLRRAFGGPTSAPNGVGQTRPNALLRVSQVGQVAVAMFPGKHLSDVSVGGTLGRELAEFVEVTAGPMAIDFRGARFIPHQMRELLLDLSGRARRRGRELAFVVKNSDQREFFTILKLDKQHKVVLDPVEV